MSNKRPMTSKTVGPNISGLNLKSNIEINEDLDIIEGELR
jgi:hypothetical protein